jgi:hypothetical protein
MCNSVAAGFSEVRSSLSHNLRDINYAARLWQVFKAIISGALNELKELVVITKVSGFIYSMNPCVSH